jgi:hypothetical protein
MFMNGEEQLPEEGKEAQFKLIPYVPCSKRNPSMCPKPDEPQVGDIFYDESLRDLVQQIEPEEGAGYVTVMADDDFDFSKIMGKAPPKKIQNVALNKQKCS